MYFLLWIGFIFLLPWSQTWPSDFIWSINFSELEKSLKTHQGLQSSLLAASVTGSVQGHDCSDGLVPEWRWRRAEPQQHWPATVHYCKILVLWAAVNPIRSHTSDIFPLRNYPTVIAKYVHKMLARFILMTVNLEIKLIYQNTLK